MKHLVRLLIAYLVLVAAPARADDEGEEGRRISGTFTADGAAARNSPARVGVRT